MQKMKVQLTDEQIEGVFKRAGPSLFCPCFWPLASCTAKFYLGADLNKDQKLSYDEDEKLVVKGRGKSAGAEKTSRHTSQCAGNHRSVCSIEVGVDQLCEVNKGFLTCDEHHSFFVFLLKVKL